MDDVKETFPKGEKEHTIRYIRGKYTKGQNESTKKYSKTHLDRIAFTVKKGERQFYKDAAAKDGLSFQQFVINALNEKIDRDGLRDIFNSAENIAEEEKK